MPLIIKPIILSLLPDIMDIIFRIIEMMVIIIVTIQAQTLPLNRPHATTKLAIPIAINMPPITPINPPRINIELFGIVTLVLFIFKEIEELELSLFSLRLI